MKMIFVWPSYLSQTTDGHTLVIPKKHFAHILEVDSQTLAHMMEVVQKVALQIEKQLHAKGFNVLTNMNEIAGKQFIISIFISSLVIVIKMDIKHIIKIVVKMSI